GPGLRKASRWQGHGGRGARATGPRSFAAAVDRGLRLPRAPGRPGATGRFRGRAPQPTRDHRRGVGPRGRFVRTAPARRAPEADHPKGAGPADDRQPAAVHRLGGVLHLEPARRGAADGDERPGRVGAAARHAGLDPRAAGRQQPAPHDARAATGSGRDGARRSLCRRAFGGGRRGLARCAAGHGRQRPPPPGDPAARFSLRPPRPGPPRPGAGRSAGRSRRGSAQQGGGAGVRGDAAGRRHRLGQDRSVPRRGCRVPAPRPAGARDAAGDRAVRAVAGPLPRPLRGGTGAVAFRGRLPHPARHLAGGGRGRGAGGGGRPQRAVPALPRPRPRPRGRGARDRLQAGGRRGVPRPRHGGGAGATGRRRLRAGLGDAQPGNAQQRRERALRRPAPAATPRRGRAAVRGDDRPALQAAGARAFPQPGPGRGRGADAGARRAGDAVPEPPRLRPADALPPLRPPDALPQLHRVAGGAPRAAAPAMPPLRPRGGAAGRVPGMRHAQLPHPGRPRRGAHPGGGRGPLAGRAALGDGFGHHARPGGGGRGGARHPGPRGGPHRRHPDCGQGLALPAPHLGRRGGRGPWLGRRRPPGGGAHRATPAPSGRPRRAGGSAGSGAAAELQPRPPGDAGAGERRPRRLHGGRSEHAPARRLAALRPLGRADRERRGGARSRPHGARPRPSGAAVRRGGGAGAGAGAARPVARPVPTAAAAQGAARRGGAACAARVAVPRGGAEPRAGAGGRGPGGVPV
ncbi:MAG: Helicase PriA essential for oriC/DnaA-independent DNA replication, partial [uncultured Acetobacteraceae bacterium]